MEECEEERYGFPFEPYNIQRQFMRGLRDALSGKKFGVFESPTGTGKSLSIVCGCLHWFFSEEQVLNASADELQLKIDSIKADESRAWFEAHEATYPLQQQLSALKTLIQYRQSIVEYLRDFGADETTNSKVFGEICRKRGLVKVEEKEGEGDTQELWKDDEAAEEKQHEKPLQIYIASRTHSQLSQLVGELRKTDYAKQIRCVTLASRSSYCINEDVRRLKSATLINDRCIELESSKSGCCYRKNARKVEEASVSILRDLATDVEEIVTKSRAIKACPFYATRRALSRAQLILLPYNLLFQESARVANKIDLSNSVLIVDEAHNLLSAIADIYAAETNLGKIRRSIDQLKAYMDKYQSKFAAQTLLNLNYLLRVMSELVAEFDRCKPSDSKKPDDYLCRIDTFLLEHSLEQINFLKLSKFLEVSRLSQKLRGFANGQNDSFLSPICSIFDFIDRFSTANFDDCRLLVSASNGSIKFLLFDPTRIFGEIVSKARVTIIAGGTMEPISEFTKPLLHQNVLSVEDILVFKSPHIVSSDRVLVLALQNSPSNLTLDFSMQSKVKPEMLSSLFQSIQLLINLIPSGVVVFFQSYKYLATFVEFLKARAFFDRLNLKKPIFIEVSKESAGDLLKRYEEEAETARGALLFAVVGGKLSEGINFSDASGRAVIMVGLPYPNAGSIELREKMRQISVAPDGGKAAARAYYEDICMKSVNQSIGRVIRHRLDYACVILLDHRYARKRDRLPDWISPSYRSIDRFGEAIRSIKSFFVKFKN